MYRDRALIPDSMVIQAVPATNGRPHSDHCATGKCLSGFPYYKGHCKVMCVSSTVYPVIISNVRGARQMLQTQTGRLKTREELELEPVQAAAMTTELDIERGVQHRGH